MCNERIEHISIAEDFSRYPAGRFMEDGRFNGTAFREQVLSPRLRALENTTIRLIVSLDGVAGVGSSFLEEAFGGLVRAEGMTKEFLDNHLTVTADDENLKDFVELAQQHIVNAARAQ